MHILLQPKQAKSKALFQTVNQGHKPFVLKLQPERSLFRLHYMSRALRCAASTESGRKLLTLSCGLANFRFPSMARRRRRRRHRRCVVSTLLLSRLKNKDGRKRIRFVVFVRCCTLSVVVTRPPARPPACLPACMPARPRTVF